MYMQQQIMAGRRAAEALMVSKVKITRPGSGQPYLDEETGDYVYPPPTVVYTGKCRLRLPNLNVKQVDAAGQQLVVQQSVLSIPLAAVGVKPNDVAEITHNQLDESLSGQRFRIVGNSEQTISTARRFSIERTS
jgi:hypothetical protein